MGFCSQRFPPPSSRRDFRRALPPGHVRYSQVISRGSGIVGTWEVRSQRSGFTRIPLADPLSAFVPL
jgi:hypothetical protein